MLRYDSDNKYQGKYLGSWLYRMVVSKVLSICMYGMVFVWAPSPPKLGLGSMTCFVSMTLSFNAILSFDKSS